MSVAVERRWVEDLPVRQARTLRPAPAVRPARDEEAAGAARPERDPLLRLMLDAIDTPVVILDQRRGIVQANAAARLLLGDADELDISPSSRGARRVHASTVTIGGETFTVVSLPELRRETPDASRERLFLHDISNTAMTIGGFLSLFHDAEPGEAKDSLDRLEHLARRLGRQIDYQRALLQAEAGELQLQATEVTPAAALQAAVDALVDLPTPTGRRLEIDGSPEEPAIVTDAVVLERVLVEMLRSALEAAGEGGTVRAWVESVPGGCEFRVWSDGSAAPDGARPHATHTMRLFGERHLGGQVDVSAEPDAGVCLTFRLPTAPERTAEEQTTS
jgi:signal transduction histidine kinase